MVEQLPRTGKAGVCGLSNYHGRPEAYFARWTSFSGRPLAADVLAVISSHVETVVKLSLKKDTPKIEVTMEPDEESNYTSEEKITYQKIKAYILEKYGFKVSSLYIAQIKDKCGLGKERTGNNGKKNDKSKEPQCTPEKEEAIRDAFKNFNII